MRTYVVRRAVQGLLVLWLVSLAIFSLVRILPGDAVIMQLDQAAAPSPESLARARQELGLERPFLAQYRTWIAKAAGVQPFTHTLAAFSPIGAGPSFMDWVYLRYHSSFPRTINREGISDPKLDDLLTTWRLDPGEKRPAIQRAIWDHLRQNVYRITTIVPPHYRITQAYVNAGANPYCWFPGYCSYEAKTAWMTDKAPSRKFDKFAQ